MADVKIERMFYNAAWPVISTLTTSRTTNENRELELQRVRPAGWDGGVPARLTARPVRRLRRAVQAASDGLRPSRPATKSFNVMTGRAMLMSTERVLAEVAKCDIVCVNCHRIRSRSQHRARIAHQAPGTSRNLGRHRRYWRRQGALLDRLRDVPCADCGERFPPCSMDFDHRDPKEKRSRVPALIGRAGDARILAEIAKCDIVCANCHRTRTVERREAVAERE
jgi:hypothetical protein